MDKVIIDNKEKEVIWNNTRTSFFEIGLDKNGRKCKIAEHKFNVKLYKRDAIKTNGHTYIIV